MGFENKKKTKTKKFSDVKRSHDGKRGEGLQNFASPRPLSVQGGHHDRGKDKVNRVNEASLMSRDPNLPRVGGVKLRLGRMQTGRDGLRAEVARVEKTRKRDRKHI